MQEFRYAPANFLIQKFVSIYFLKHILDGLFKATPAPQKSGAICCGMLNFSKIVNLSWTEDSGFL